MSSVRNIYFQDDIAESLNNIPNVSKLINDLLREHLQVSKPLNIVKKETEKVIETELNKLDKIEDQLSEQKVLKEREETIRQEKRKEREKSFDKEFLWYVTTFDLKDNKPEDLLFKYKNTPTRIPKLEIVDVDEFMQELGLCEIKNGDLP